MTTATNTQISYANPFRKDSDAWDVYDLLRDGVAHTLGELTAEAGGSPDSSMWRRRTSSTIRYVRAKVRDKMSVDFDGILRTYRLRVWLA